MWKNRLFSLCLYLLSNVQGQYESILVNIVQVAVYTLEKNVPNYTETLEKKCEWKPSTAKMNNFYVQRHHVH